MKIFLDTANVTDISDRFSSGLIDGVTTNPTLILKSGRSPEQTYQNLVDLGISDISMEVVGQTKGTMISQALALSDRFGEDATIKVPCTVDGLKACQELSSNHGIRVNVTLIFSAAQAILAAKAGASYVSPFVGRLNDNSICGISLIREINQIYKVQEVRTTKILSASIRNVRDAIQSYHFGADIVTMPPKVFDEMYGHVLTDVGVGIFEQHWKEVPDLLPCDMDPV